jgi:ketosteroid isomerase-like protein
MNFFYCFRTAAIVILLLPMHGEIFDRVAASDSQPGVPCTAPEYRQFDFWIGDWDAYDFDNPTVVVAHNRVTNILGGCVLLEDYQDANGHKGQSFSIYDGARKSWHQSWVTNRGVLLLEDGTFENGAMTLTASDQTADGKKKLVRGVWKRVDGGVRETGVTSIDNGKTWQPWFDLVFRPAKGGAASTKSDEETIAALDTAYQAAVKINDAAAMDRFLADDFKLVVGSGKTYTKADLLEEARSGRVQYEHQEDTEQSARVWGDTAVITAKLWEKGTDNGKPFDKTVWFSDTYARASTGWRYVFGQSSFPPPKATQ